MEPLLETLGDKESEVRAEAARSLGKINDPRAVEKLITALQDEKEEVRRTAAIALGKIKDPRAVEPLIASLKDEKAATVRRRAAVALGEIQDPQAEAFLLAAFKNGNLEAVAGAHAFFIRRGEPGTETQLIKALQEYGYIRMAENFVRCGNPTVSPGGPGLGETTRYSVEIGKSRETPSLGDRKIIERDPF